MIRWSILIATLARRQDRLCELLDDLRDQVNAAHGAVEVVALRNHGERPLGEIRQDLVEDARGEYLSFVDDDDRLPPYYVPSVLPLLDGVDYIGWQMQAYRHGFPLKPTYHSLRYTQWFETDAAYYRDVSHLNPVRTELARKADFRLTRPPEDVSWTDQMRPHLRTEHYVGDDVMYHYMATEDSAWRPGSEPAWDGGSDLLTTPVAHLFDDVAGFRWHGLST